MTRPTLDDYRALAPEGTIDFLRRLSERIRHRTLLNVSASREVGGVAEILRGLVPLLEEVGVESTWESVDLDGGAATIGARLHHALQGGEERPLEGPGEAAQHHRAQRELHVPHLVVEQVHGHLPPPEAFRVFERGYRSGRHTAQGR